MATNEHCPVSPVAVSPAAMHARWTSLPPVDALHGVEEAVGNDFLSFISTLEHDIRGRKDEVDKVQGRTASAGEYTYAADFEVPMNMFTAGPAVKPVPLFFAQPLAETEDAASQRSTDTSPLNDDNARSNSPVATTHAYGEGKFGSARVDDDLPLSSSSDEEGTPVLKSRKHEPSSSTSDEDEDEDEDDESPESTPQKPFAARMRPVPAGWIPGGVPPGYERSTASMSGSESEEGELHNTHGDSSIHLGHESDACAGASQMSPEEAATRASFLRHLRYLNENLNENAAFQNAGASASDKQQMYGEEQEERKTVQTPSRDAYPSEQRGLNEREGFKNEQAGFKDSLAKDLKTHILPTFSSSSSSSARSAAAFLPANPIPPHTRSNTGATSSASASSSAFDNMDTNLKGRDGNVTPGSSTYEYGLSERERYDRERAREREREAEKLREIDRYSLFLLYPSTKVQILTPGSQGACVRARARKGERERKSRGPDALLSEYNP